MPQLPRPASPRALWRDLRDFFGARRPHQLIAGVLALAIPLVIGTAFLIDTMEAGEAPAQIIYVESWPEDRSREEIVAKQALDAERLAQQQAERQRQFQRLDQSLNKLGI